MSNQPNLDKFYREQEGWGLLTDAALNIPPTMVESQARAVATHAMTIINDLTNILVESQNHHDYCGWGDPWESSCARDDKLPERLTAAILNAQKVIPNGK